MKITAQAYQKYIRQSPRKLRLVADMIRGKEIEEAITMLTFTAKRAARTMKLVLLQARANAKLLPQAADVKFRVEDIQIEEGPRLKRWRPVSRGRAHPILKRMSHIKVVAAGLAKTTPGAK